MVTPEVVTGHPAHIALSRAILLPVAPSGKPQPMKTSSTSPASIPARPMACLTAWPPITAPWVWLKPPRTDLARPVRAVETITACLMSSLVALPRRWLNLAVRALGCQCRVTEREGDGRAKGQHADGDAAVKRRARNEGDRAVRHRHG